MVVIIYYFSVSFFLLHPPQQELCFVPKEGWAGLGIYVENNKAGTGEGVSEWSQLRVPSHGAECRANLPCREASGTWHLEPSACGDISPTFWRSGTTELMPHKKPFVKMPIFASHS